MRLRSIPPANRTLGRLSSMRAATTSGMIFVGSASQPAKEPDFKPHIIKPDQQAQQAREAFHKALATKREQLLKYLEELEGQTDKWLLQEAQLIREELFPTQGKGDDNELA